MNILKIKNDTDPVNPRDYNYTDCNLGKMICFHKKYDLGDKHNYKEYNFDSWNELKSQLIKDFKTDLLIPLFLYDHSGITISTTNFNSQWDSGQIGFIVLDKAQLKKVCNVKLIKKDKTETYLDYLRQEVHIYNKYLIGDVWMYEVVNENTEEVIESCGGFYDYQDANAEGLQTLKNYQ